MIPPSELDKLVGRLAVLPSESNRARLAAYLREEANRVRLSTLRTRLEALIPLGMYLGQRPWIDARREDVIAVISGHRNQQGRHLGALKQDRPLAGPTKLLWSHQFGGFYKWLLDIDETPPQVRRLPFRKVDATAQRIRERALKPLEIRKLLSGAQTPRDKAIVITLLETGFRASELAALRLDGLFKKNHGGTTGYWVRLGEAEHLKTGPREVDVPVIGGSRVLEAWLSEHPRRNEAAATLFVNLSPRAYGQRMNGAGISAVVSACARRAGLRHTTAHDLRFTSATLKLARNMQPDAVRLIHGWSARSSMLGYYARANINVHYQALALKAYGLASDEPELRDVLGSLPCAACGQTLHVAAEKCQGCGTPNSQPLIESQVTERRRHVLAYISTEVAAGLGLPAATDEQALKSLGEHYRATTDREPGDDKFTRWCMRRWAELQAHR